MIVQIKLAAVVLASVLSCGLQGADSSQKFEGGWASEEFERMSASGNVYETRAFFRKLSFQKSGEIVCLVNKKTGDLVAWIHEYKFKHNNYPMCEVYYIGGLRFKAVLSNSNLGVGDFPNDRSSVLISMLNDCELTSEDRVNLADLCDQMLSLIFREEFRNFHPDRFVSFASPNPETLAEDFPDEAVMKFIEAQELIGQMFDIMLARLNSAGRAELNGAKA